MLNAKKILVIHVSMKQYFSVPLTIVTLLLLTNNKKNFNKQVVQCNVLKTTFFNDVLFLTSKA